MTFFVVHYAAVGSPRRGLKLPQPFESKILSQIAPIEIILFDQINLPMPVPALELFLSRDSKRHRIKLSEIDEPFQIIFASKSSRPTGTMFMEAFQKIGSHANVQNAIFPVGHDIDAWLEVHDTGIVDGDPETSSG